MRIRSHRAVARGTWCLELDGEAGITAPGQFVNLQLPGFYLRRPLSVCDWTEDSLTLIYRVVGRGTAALAEMEPGTQLSVLCPLGNGYDLAAIPEDAVLVGGGAGIPPLYGLARRLVSRGDRPQVLLGFNEPDELFLVDEFRALGLDTEVSVGGFVTDRLSPGHYVCACGPEAMLHAVDELSAAGQYSFEARMACGFGACMGCSCRTRFGSKRICKDGPVLRKEETAW